MSENEDINYTKNGNTSFIYYTEPHLLPLRKRKDSYSKMKLQVQKLLRIWGY